MTSLLLSIDSDDSTPRAVAALLASEPIILPTDTVYGLAAIAGDTEARAKIFELKGRPDGQALALLVANIAQARTLVHVDDRFEALAAAFWPGGLTIVTAAVSDVADKVKANDSTLGVRVPQQSWVRSLAAEVGPLVATSANKHGVATPSSPAEVAELFPETLVIDAGMGGKVASTVIRLLDGSIEVLRHGKVSEHEIRNRSCREFGDDCE
ncbi:MAG: L-threonylcarbamoyladenylate synthase [Acidimicrobiales bacterium]